MADGNDPSAEVSQSVEEYAEQAKQDVNGDGGGGWLGGIFDTVADMGARADAMAAAANAGQFAMNPDLADAMKKQFNAMQDVIVKMKANANRLATATPLGGGYGTQIGQMNAGVGQNAINLTAEFQKKINALKEAVEKSVANYESNDASGAGSMKKIN